MVLLKTVLNIAIKVLVLIPGEMNVYQCTDICLIPDSGPRTFATRQRSIPRQNRKLLSLASGSKILISSIN